MQWVSFAAGLAGGLVAAAILVRAVASWYLKPFRRRMDEMITKVTADGGEDLSSIATRVVRLERQVADVRALMRTIIRRLDRPR